jgi:DNA polymerase III subunit delta'
MKFSDIPGHFEFKQKLVSDFAQQRVPHAMMFLGKEGTAGLPLALAFAQYIHCTAKLESDSCGVCPSCIKASKWVHPDLHFSFPTVSIGSSKPTSNDFVEFWREALTENPYLNYITWIKKIAQENKLGNITVAECHSIIKKLSLQSFESEYKILVMWLPEYLGQQGNVLLKLLEEPPKKTIFFLVANDYNKIIGTIRSRTQLFKIQNYSIEEIETFLKSKGVEQEKANQVAYIAEGNINLALEMLQGETYDYTTDFRTWMQLCAARKVPDLMQWADQQGAQGRTANVNFLQQSLRILRECNASKTIDNYRIKLQMEHHEFVKNFGQFLDYQKLEYVYNEVNKSIYHIQRNANAKITLFNLSLKIKENLKTKTAA